MATIPINFSTSTDLEINQTIKGLWQDIVDKKGDINTVMVVAPLIQTCLLEIHKRNLDSLSMSSAKTVNIIGDLKDETRKLREFSETTSKSAEKFNIASLRNANWSLIVTFVSIVISVIALFFAFKSDSSDKEWMKSEIQILKQIEISLQRTGINLPQKSGVWK